MAGLQGPCPPKPACPCLRRPSPRAPWQRHVHWLAWQLRPRPSGPGEGCGTGFTQDPVCIHSQPLVTPPLGVWKARQGLRQGVPCRGGLFSRGAHLGCGAAPLWQGEVAWRV